MGNESELEVFDGLPPQPVSSLQKYWVRHLEGIRFMRLVLPSLCSSSPRSSVGHYSAEAVKSLGESDAVTGTLPLESRFNDIITEFLLYKDEKIFALVFDPSAETWHLLESREYTQETVHDVEEELMDRLYDWREEHVLPYLVENDLIPNFEF